MKIFLIIFVFLFIQVYAQTHKIHIMIDAGHGGKDPGNLPSQDSLLQEKEINLLISNTLIEKLKESDEILVSQTRSEDQSVSLESRVSSANQKKVDYFVSIHCNHNKDSTIHGFRVHIFSHKNKKASNLGKYIEKQLSEVAGRKSLGVRDTREYGVCFMVLKKTEMTSLLIETAFMSNYEEELYLNTEEGRTILATSIYQGILNFIENQTVNTDIVKNEKKNNQTSADYYKVQVLASYRPESMKKFNSAPYKIEEVIVGDSQYKYKYMVSGKFSQSEANIVRKKMINAGYSGAFVIKQKNN